VTRQQPCRCDRPHHRITVAAAVLASRCGKALNERKTEIRLQLKPPPGAAHMFPGVEIPPNELVIRLQPDEAIYMKVSGQPSTVGGRGPST
jgi:glucose-6-phosphate 1-dehydrogenase